MGVFKCLFLISHVTFLSAFTPIVMIPGLGGSQIYAKLNRKKVNFGCQKTSDWFNIWVNQKEWIWDGLLDCWVDNFKMEYNETTGKMQDRTGVSFKVPGFGNTSTIEWLDPALHTDSTEYFADLVKYLVKQHGYRRGINLTAAPYDFRRDPSMASDYMVRLKKLIEKTYEINRNTPVLLVSHSMGAPYTLHFLHSVSKEWKRKYIKAWISVSGALAGAVRSVRGFISGIGLLGDTILLQPPRFPYAHVLLKFERTSPGLAFLLPDPTFWHSNEKIVETSSKNYSVEQITEILKDTGFSPALNIFKTTPKAWRESPPEVRMFCFHGKNKPTPAKYYYGNGNFTDHAPTVKFGDGDGTVNLRSLEACTRWVGKQDEKITHKIFKGAEHTDILKDDKLFQAIDSVLAELNADDVQQRLFSSDEL